MLFQAVAVIHGYPRWKNRPLPGDHSEIVTALGVLGLVDTCGFFFGADTQPDRVFQDQSQDKGNDPRVKKNPERPNPLPFQLGPAAAVEQSLGYARDAVDG